MHLYKSALIIFLCSLTVNATQGSQPVKYGGNEDLDACSTLAVVTDLGTGADAFLAVKSAPNIKSKRTDKIFKDQAVWICDETKEWYGVVYTQDSKQECGVTTAVKKKDVYKGPCKSGWVSKKYVEPQAG